MTRVKCKCRACGFKGSVRLILAKRTKTSKHRLGGLGGVTHNRQHARPKVDSCKGVPATSVPCPKCGRHKLKRLRVVMA